MLALWEREPASVGELCACLHLDVGTLSPLLKRMEQAGLVSRARDRHDDRKVIVALTPHGRSLRQEALAVPRRWRSRSACGPKRPQPAPADPGAGRRARVDRRLTKSEPALPAAVPIPHISITPRWKSVPTERDFPRRSLSERERQLRGRQTAMRARRRPSIAARALAASLGDFDMASSQSQRQTRTKRCRKMTYCHLPGRQSAICFSSALVASAKASLLVAYETAHRLRGCPFS